MKIFVVTEENADLQHFPLFPNCFQNFVCQVCVKNWTHVKRACLGGRVGKLTDWEYVFAYQVLSEEQLQNRYE